MMTRSQTLDSKGIYSRVSSLVRSARVPPRIRGIRYVKPRRLCAEHDKISPVKKSKVQCLGHQPPSKPSPQNGQNLSKEFVADVPFVSELPHVTPKSGVEADPSDSDDDSYNQCLCHAWHTPQCGLTHAHYCATTRTLKQNP